MWWSTKIFLEDDRSFTQRVSHIHTIYMTPTCHVSLTAIFILPDGKTAKDYTEKILFGTKRTTLTSRFLGLLIVDNSYSNLL